MKVADVQAWREQLEARHKLATVYARISRLSSFYEWVMKDAWALHHQQYGALSLPQISEGVLDKSTLFMQVMLVFIKIVILILPPVGL